VAEYRPNSQSIIYRVDPETMKAEEMFRFKDHIGGLVRDTEDNSLHGVSWGSRAGSTAGPSTRTASRPMPMRLRSNSGG
jgi:hypothetical protein